VFVEAVVFLTAIVGVLLALSSFVFHMITRKPEEEKEAAEQRIDAAIDTALEEITRTSQLVLDELDEKYKALLFVYQLMDDKKKELEGDKKVEETAADGDEAAFLGSLDISVGDELFAGDSWQVPDEDMASFIRGLGDSEEVGEAGETETVAAAEEAAVAAVEAAPVFEAEPEVEELVPFLIPRKVMAHPRFGEIKALRDEGMALADIARRLNMGKGEVQLIIGLSGG